MNDQNQIRGASLEIEENLREQLMAAEGKIRQLEQDMNLTHRKY
jgi:hypothetical protein